MSSKIIKRPTQQVRRFAQHCRVMFRRNVMQNSDQQRGIETCGLERQPRAVGENERQINKTQVYNVACDDPNISLADCFRRVTDAATDVKNKPADWQNDSNKSTSFCERERLNKLARRISSGFLRQRA